MTIIEFRSPEMAEKVHAHLYNVTIDGTKLFFSKFDRVAFYLVINLENLSRADYSVFDTEGGRNGLRISRPSHVYCQQAQRSIVLNISLYIISGAPRLATRDRGIQLIFNDPTYHRFQLLACDSFQLPREAINEIPLEINLDLLEFANLIQTEIMTGLSQVARAFCEIDNFHGLSQYSLRLENSDCVQSFRFYPVQVSLDVNRT